MWLCVLLALAAFQDAICLHEIQPFDVDPTALSNIELLVPLALPVARPERTDRSSRFRDDRLGSAKQRAQDKSYSSMPAYTFTLNRKGPTPRASKTSSPLPKLAKNRSLFLAQLWSRFNGKTKDTAHKSSRDACRALAGKQLTSSSRELLLYICDELMDVLATRCGCCDDERSEERMERALPRFDMSSLSLLSLNGRRDTHGADTIQHSRPRVFV